MKATATTSSGGDSEDDRGQRFGARGPLSDSPSNTCSSSNEVSPPGQENPEPSSSLISAPSPSWVLPSDRLAVVCTLAVVPVGTSIISDVIADVEAVNGGRSSASAGQPALPYIQGFI